MKNTPAFIKSQINAYVGRDFSCIWDVSQLATCSMGTKCKKLLLITCFSVIFLKISYWLPLEEKDYAHKLNFNERWMSDLCWLLHSSELLAALQAIRMQIQGLSSHCLCGLWIYQGLPLPTAELCVTTIWTLPVPFNSGKAVPATPTNDSNDVSSLCTDVQDEHSHNTLPQSSSSEHWRLLTSETSLQESTPVHAEPCWAQQISLLRQRI